MRPPTNHQGLTLHLLGEDLAILSPTQLAEELTSFLDTLPSVVIGPASLCEPTRSLATTPPAHVVQ